MPPSAHRSFIIKMRETRNSGSRKARILIHEADLSTALSFHLEVKTPEPAIKLAGNPAITSQSGERLGTPGAFDSARLTDELFTVYSSSIDRRSRPSGATVEIKYSLYTTAIAPDLFALAPTLIAISVALFFRSTIGATFAGVIFIPTTVVSGFISVRDSVLVSSFLRPLRLALPILDIVLWICIPLAVGLSYPEVG